LFGDKSLAWIRKNAKGYAIIKTNTANDYIMRLTHVIKCALENGIVAGINAASGKCFPDNKVPELDRKSYDKGDMERLVDTVCTKPLYGQKEKKDYRFWIILIALFHGFRLSNIVNLKKKMIIIKGGLVGFDFTQYTLKDVKTADALQFFPMHWALQAIGFSDWVEKQRDGRLFKDSSSTFSKWYNHNDTYKDGTIRSQGFEPKYVTTDPKKCLYSLRHNFDQALVDAGVDFKYVKELMTHAPDKRDQTRFRYLKRDNAALMRALDVMILQGIDLDRLADRAIELFDI
jgi:integrase